MQITKLCTFAKLSNNIFSYIASYNYKIFIRPPPLIKTEALLQDQAVLP